MPEPVSSLPVAVFAYDRPELLEQTLACLRDAGFRRLHVFSDGPRGEEDAPRVERVRSLVRGLDWAEPVLVERERNLGLSRSIRGGLDSLFEQVERLVVIEDDVAVAPEFGAYAAAVLERYADDERVAGLTGLRLPFPRSAFRGYEYDAYVLPRFFSWSWATWRRAWQTFDFDRERLLRRLRESDARPELAGADLPYMIRAALVEETLGGSWDVAAATSMVLEGQHFVAPTWNMVENIGWSYGTHPQSPRWTLRWEQEHRPADLRKLRLPPPELDPRIHKAFRVFRENPQGWTLRRLVPRPARMLLRRLRGTYDPLS